MLLSFRFANFRSFRKEQELSLVAGPFKDRPEVILRSEGLRDGVLPVAAIYGANASGKTNVLRALAFMAKAVRASHRAWPPDGPVPAEPFALGQESKRAPSRFVADFLVDGKRHQYGFALDSEAVLEEWLFAYPTGKKQTWFSRKSGEPMSFGAKMPGENRMIENLTRKNSLFLSAAAQNNHETLLPVYKWFSSSLSFVAGERRDVLQEQTASLCEKGEDRKAIVHLMAVADLGVEDVTVHKESFSTGQRQILETLASALESKGTVQIPEARIRVQLLHRVGSKAIPLELEEESDGTRAFFSLLGPTLDALKAGGIVCIDELDASLHSLLAIQLIRLFSERSTNPRAAQLIFNTHDTNLLSSGLLRRDQIWFTEKSNDASTHLYPLSDFKPRRNENLESGYLQGRYGAIPFINPEAFVRCFEASDGEA